MNNDKYRMYGLIPYNLSPIQQGIQFGHAVVEYGLKHFDKEEYKEWANDCKTFIILNGGTTNKEEERKGTLNQVADKIWDMGIYTARFYEPDLGDQLTAVVFIVPEEIYNKTKFPDFKDFVEKEKGKKFLQESIKQMLSTGQDKLEVWFADLYKEWTTLMGGQRNIDLRELLRPFKLA